MIVSVNANNVQPTQEFVRELRELMRRHNLAVVPSQDGQRNFHDPLYVVPLDESVDRFYQNSLLTDKGDPEFEVLAGIYERKDVGNARRFLADKQPEVDTFISFVLNMGSKTRAVFEFFFPLLSPVQVSEMYAKSREFRKLVIQDLRAHLHDGTQSPIIPPLEKIVDGHEASPEVRSKLKEVIDITRPLK